MSAINPGVVGSSSSSGAALVVIGGNSSFVSGTQTVATAETRVQLSSVSVPCKKIYIQSSTSNTGNMFVGDSTVSSSNGLILYPGGATLLTFTVNNLNLIWLDAAVNGSVCVYAYEN